MSPADVLLLIRHHYRASYANVAIVKPGLWPCPTNINARIHTQFPTSMTLLAYWRFRLRGESEAMEAMEAGGAGLPRGVLGGSGPAGADFRSDHGRGRDHGTLPLPWRLPGDPGSWRVRRRAPRTVPPGAASGAGLTSKPARPDAVPGRAGPGLATPGAPLTPLSQQRHSCAPSRLKLAVHNDTQYATRHDTE